MADKPQLPPRPGEVEAELGFHVEMLIRRYVAEGLEPAAARRRALERLGSLESVRHACDAIQTEGESGMRPAIWLAGRRRDLRDAWRGLRRSPALVATTVATLAVGVGATTAMFSVFHAVLLGAMPYRHADRMVMVWNSYGPSLPQAAVSAAEFADFAEFLAAPRGFDRIAAVRVQQASLEGACGGGQASCDPERINVYVVSPNLFELAGVEPALGRPFTDSDGAADTANVVLLSDALWQRRFAGDRAVVGRTVTIGGTPATVVGVMPQGVRFPDEPLGFLRERADLWMAYRWERNRADGRGNQNLALVARLADGATLDEARIDVDRLANQFRQEFPDRYAREGLSWRLIVVPFREQMVGDIRASLVMLFAAVALVLLIACANVTSLLLTRGVTRAREFAVRSALGAGRERLIALSLTEAGLLAAAGSALGLFLAWAGVRMLQRLDPGRVPRLDMVTIDWRVLVFTAGLATLTALIVGLVPALRQSRVGPRQALGDDGTRGAGTSVVRPGLRRALVIGEVGLAAIVLVWAGLLGRSLSALESAPTGMDADGVVTFDVSPPRDRYGPGEPVLRLQQALTEQLEALPGVVRAATIYPLPMSGERWSGTFGIDGRPVPDGQPDPHAEFAVASPGYFEAAGITLVEGREFTAFDRVEAPMVAIVDEDLARRYWPGESAVGKRLDTDDRLDPTVATIVGVVSHVRNGGPRDDGEPQVYLASGQYTVRSVSLVVRTRDPEAIIAGARAAVRAVDPALPVARLATMNDRVASVFGQERFNAVLLDVFGSVALLLAVVGLYGVLGSLVAQRAHEIGIRLALGGRPAQLMRRVLGEGLMMTAAGVVLGLGAAALLGGGLEGLLFGVPPVDPVTYAIIALLLLVTAVVASAAPARRALSVDPMRVLRE